MNTHRHKQPTSISHTADKSPMSNTVLRRVPMMLAVILMSAVAHLVGLPGAAPANAAPAPSFVAIAGGELNDAPPVQTVAGFSQAADANSAGQSALTNCVNVGGRQCVVEVTSQGTCVAAVANDFGDIKGGSGPTTQAAIENATQALQNTQGIHTLRTGCAANVATPPAPPKQAPLVAFNPILGGLDVHVTDRSGVASQCTFAMDDISRNFALAANTTLDLKVVPAIPQFRDRTVAVTCDNGTRIQTTTRF